jgi:hypothetical protein
MGTREVTGGRHRAGGMLGVLLSLAPWPAGGEPLGPQEGLLSLETHGFASQGFLLTTGNDYLTPDSKKGSFQFSEVGLNFSRELTDRLRFGVQFFARNFGPAGNYIPQVDWFHLDYRWRDWLGVRAGRLKIPLGLYNEVNDIDSSRVPVLLPQSVYPEQARSFLFAQTGGEIYGFLRLGGAGALDYRLYGGTIFIDPNLFVPVGTPVAFKFNVPYALGGRLLWETPVPGLRVGGSVIKLRLDAVAFLPMAMTVGVKNNTVEWVTSAEYVRWALTLTAEYGRNHVDQESVVPTSNFKIVSEGGYLMATYAVASWVQPGIYYAFKFPDVDKREGLDNQQHDLALTLRFDINRHWLLKLEGHYMVGTAGLLNPLRVSSTLESPEPHWAVFAVKTTAYF